MFSNASAAHHTQGIWTIHIKIACNSVIEDNVVSCHYDVHYFLSKFRVVHWTTVHNSRVSYTYNCPWLNIMCLIISFLPDNKRKINYINPWCSTMSRKHRRWSCLTLKIWEKWLGWRCRMWHRSAFMEFWKINYPFDRKCNR